MKDKTYDTPDTEDVLQEDEPSNIVPVRVENVVRIDEMPTSSAFMNRILATGAKAEKLLNADPRRKKFVLWAIALGAGVDGIMIGNRSTDADDYTGAFLYINNPGLLRYEFTTCDEVWVRPVIANESGGTWTGYAASTDDAILSVVIEQWAN